MGGPDTHQQTLTSVVEAMEHLKPVNEEILLYRKDGTSFWCDLQFSPIADDQQQHPNWLIVMRDITLRKEANRALKEVSASHQAMVECLGASAGVWDWDVTTDRMKCSPPVRETLGYGPEDADFPQTASAFFKIMHPDDMSRIRDSIDNGILARNLVEHELRFRHKDGRYIWLSSRGTVTYDEDGKPKRIVRVSYDISSGNRSN